MITRLLALCVVTNVALTPAVGTCNQSEHGIPYTQAQVQENVVRYATIVFGLSEPTLNDYFALEGSADEAEYEFEQLECQQKWPSDYAACDRWTDLRLKEVGSAPSLYYRALRGKLPQVSPKLIIKTIARLSNAPRAPYLVKAIGADGVTILTFVHEYDYYSGDAQRRSGVVTLVAVNGQGLDSLFGDVELQTR